PDAVEVVEVPCRARGPVLVVADPRVREVVRAAPGGAVGGLELGEGRVLVLLVAERDDAAQARVDYQVRGGLLAAVRGRPVAAVVRVVAGVAGDVAGGADDGVWAADRRGGGGWSDGALVEVGL